ncbi:hypothetical protein BT69DRAFT_1301929 [Atractiella rhizophila]|nr:hypothetical protein BT69DRAFT_1301929 [Atractiella rhizophila]
MNDLYASLEGLLDAFHGGKEVFTDVLNVNHTVGSAQPKCIWEDIWGGNAGVRSRKAGKHHLPAHDLKEQAEEMRNWLKKEYDAANHLYAVTAWSAFARTHFTGTTPQHWTEHMAVLEKNLTDFVKYARKSAQATLVDFTPEWISNTINTIMLEEGLSEVQKAQEHALITRSATPVRGGGNSGSVGEKGRRNGSNRFPPCPHCSLRSHTSQRCWELEANRIFAPPGSRFGNGCRGTGIHGQMREDTMKEVA